LSGSNDFVTILDSELELTCGAHSAIPGDSSSAFPATDNESEDEDPKELEVSHNKTVRHAHPILPLVGQ
jgi:RNA polymerase II C-terminal domain phosphatase-like 3/4